MSAKHLLVLGASPHRNWPHEVGLQITYLSRRTRPTAWQLSARWSTLQARAIIVQKNERCPLVVPGLLDLQHPEAILYFEGVGLNTPRNSLFFPQ